MTRWIPQEGGGLINADQVIRFTVMFSGSWVILAHTVGGTHEVETGLLSQDDAQTRLESLVDNISEA